MRRFVTMPMTVVIFAFSCAAQNQDSFVSVVEHRWERVRIPGQKLENRTAAPQRMLTADDKYYQRATRENRPKGVADPSEYTTDGRSAALENSVQEARSVKTDDISGYRYVANVKNNSERKIEVLFWEYRFTEFANTENVVRRQFLCSAKMKPGEKLELSALSTLGPSEVISSESLKDPTLKLFDEKVFLNRIEFADGAILQRRDWKMAEVEASVKKAIAAPWGKEACKLL